MSRLHLSLLFVSTLSLGACNAIVGDDDLNGDDGSREVSTAKTCSVASSMVNVRTCVPTTVSGVKTVSCYAVGSVFATQRIPSVLPLTDLTSPLDADETLLGGRLKGLGLVTGDLPKDLIAYNQALATVRGKLDAAASNQCKAGAWKIGAVDNLIKPNPPKSLGFICGEMTNGTKLLECDNPRSVTGVDSAQSSPSSMMVNGLSIAFAKTGCGAFRYTLTNTQSSKVSFASSVSGIELAPPCSYTLGGYSSGSCNVTGIKGGGVRNLSYSGTVTRGSSTQSFYFAISVRCD
jgi:hypothetical protein